MEAITDRGEVPPATRAPELFGHPRGLWVLGGTELWDRISFHGMVAMLVLYMTSDLAQPGRVDNVLGFTAYRHLIEGIFGPLTWGAVATQTFGLYYAAITFLPIFGGWLGDKLISRRIAVSLGALTMTAGHFAMAFDRTFLIALMLLVVGAGLLRGNLSPQIRSLYATGDRRIADAFQFYAFTVNFGAFIAPLASGAVAKYYGWHAGFAVAGFGMLIGLAWYLAGSRHLPPEPQRGVTAPRVPFTPADWRNVATLFMVWPISIAFWTAQAQIWNVYNLWVRDHIAMHIGSFEVPIPWLQSLDGLAPAAFAPVVILLWRWQARRNREPDTFVKLAQGCLIFAAGTLLLAATPLFAGADGKGPLWLPVLFHLVSNFGAIFFAPVMHAFYASRAPESWRGTLIGFETLSVSVASLLSGTMGGWYEVMTPSMFWTVNAGIVGGAGVVLLLAYRPLRAWIGPDTAPVELPAGAPMP